MNDHKFVRRDELSPGDVALSTHYGRSVVQSVSPLGDGKETTRIVWVGRLNGNRRVEHYPSNLPIRLVHRPKVWYLTVDGLIAWIRQGPSLRPVAEFEADAPIFAAMAHAYNVRVVGKLECNCGSVDKYGDDLDMHTKVCPIWRTRGIQ